MRLFVAIDVGDEARRRIGDLLPQLKAAAPRSKWVALENLHLTIAFLGNVADERAPDLAAALGGAAASHRAFTFTVAGGGAFGSPRRPRVLWAGVQGGTFAPLARDVEAALVPFGYTPEERDYHPHVTLARAREQRGDAPLADCVPLLQALPPIEVNAGELLLMKSTTAPKGPKYEPIHRAPLAR